eukprot:3835002-Amphidinium_carterae.1
MLHWIPQYQQRCPLATSARSTESWRMLGRLSIGPNCAAKERRDRLFSDAEHPEEPCAHEPGARLVQFFVGA